MSTPLHFKTEITGRHVLFAMMGFFFIVTAVDAFMIYKALSTFGGVETQDAYRKGLHYNERIEKEKIQRDLGWKDATQLDGRKDELSVLITDKFQKGVEGLKITAIVGRPTTNKDDRTLELQPVGSGRYAGQIFGLESGAWIATLRAEKTPFSGEDILYQSKVRLWKAP